MYKTLFICAVLAAAVYAANDDIESLLDQVFGNKNQTTIKPVTQDPVTKDKSCTTEKGEVGECTLFYKCEEKETVTTADGLDIIFQDSNRRSSNDPCPSHLESCCPLSDIKHI